MYSRFQLAFTTSEERYYNLGMAIYQRQKDSARISLDHYLSPDQVIDGSLMQSDWFPQIDADIFLSHSHADEKLAITLAGMLAQLKLKVFIDSCIWGYAPDLLKAIDDRFCMNAERTAYDYQERNKSTSHIYMMLSSALNSIIDKTECTIFLNTPNSITTSGIIDETNSPWIYAEIAMTKSIRKKALSDYRDELVKGIKVRMFAESFDVRYKLDLSHLIKLTNADLIKWVNTYSSAIAKPDFALDTLYELLGKKANLNS